MSAPSATTQQRILEGKVAIVTGASRGIGAAIAKRLAADGALVAVNYAKSSDAAATVVKEIKAAGGEAHAFQADVASKEQIFRLVEEVVRHWGRLDILVNNAATPGVASAVEDVTEDVLENVLATNFKGPLWGIQAASKVLKSGGSIINITSIASRGWPDLSVYGATKAAVQTLSITAAKELGPRGIRVNSVAPGVIPTDMSRGAFPPGGYEQMEAQTKQLTPLEHRVGTVEEVANVVAFLAGPEASWVTAQTIDVAGGA